MTDETSPVSPDEVVVRLIWVAFYTPDRPVPVSEGAFRPKPGETDGISVFRTACLNDPRDVLAVISPDKRDKYALALVPVSELMALGLTVCPAKIDAVPGHAVVPELNVTGIPAGAAGRALLRQLAVIASKNLIPPAG
jgi:hypothetical protein